MVRFLFCAAAFLVMAGPFAGDPRAESAEQNDRTSPEIVVLSAPSRPVLVGLRVRVDGGSVDQFRERAVARWFRQLDRNADGVLSQAEIGDFVKKLGDESPAATRPTWQNVDTDPADGKVSLPEFRAFVNRQLGPTLKLANRTQAGNEVDASLFHHLDLNGDGILTIDELRQARRSLSPLDADDDETVSVAELAAASRERKSRETGQTADAVVSMSSPNGAQGLPPQLELSVELFDQERGRPRVSISPGKDPPKYEWRPASAESGTLVVDGLEIGLSAKRTRASAGDMSRFYALRFRIVDKDKNGYLDRREFQALGLPSAEFRAVDADGNGQIGPAELAGFLNKSANVLTNQVIVAVTDESPSLFEFLDTRRDGRLGPRELNAAAARLAELDRNKDGRITRGELRTRIRVEFELKRPAEPRPTRPIPPRGSPSSEVVPRDRGPEWFLRMDRNYDGDVSWREFLGPRQVFDRLDTDHDGLLSPEEAEHAVP